MSAIAAILRFHEEPVRDGEIERLVGMMRRRGPDGIATWREGSIAFGHGMLHATPESLGESQPLVAEDGRFRMVWDGRIDNRDDLRHELALHRVMPRNETDPELVLQTFLIHRDRTPERLLGDFAFAIWDAIERRLFCARDHVGARPFYYVLNDHCFALASEDEALLTLPGVSAEPNEERIAYALVPSFSCFDWQQSWLKDVRILMPATSISVTADRRIARSTYSTLKVAAEPTFASDEECEEAFLEVFGASVRARMRINGNVAAMMSGGMDSASIYAMARRLLPEFAGKQFRTYSAIADDQLSSIESRSIVSLTAGSGSDVNYVSVPSFTGMASLDDLLEVAWAEPHPVNNSILLPAIMCLAASRRGDRVLLHGASGDVAMNAPMHYLRYMYRERGLRATWHECRLAAQNHTYLHGISAEGILLRNLYRGLFPEVVQSIVARARHGGSPAATERSAVSSELATRLRIEQRLHRARVLTRRAEATDSISDHLHSLLPMGVVRGLEGCERVSGRYGVEVRDPWGDVRVLRFFLSLPVRYKVRDGWTKYLPRRLFEAECTTAVVRRRDKEHLGWYFAETAWNYLPQFQENVPSSPGSTRPNESRYSRLEKYLRNPVRSDGDSSKQRPLLHSLDGWLQRIERLGNGNV